jgi:hypothetical protein
MKSKTKEARAAYWQKRMGELPQGNHRQTHGAGGPGIRMRVGRTDRRTTKLTTKRVRLLRKPAAVSG